MNVLLISPQKNLDIIGLKYIHYYLLKHGVESSILCLPNFHRGNSKAIQNLEYFLREHEPKLVGMSLMSREFTDARAITAIAKETLNAPVVWGGIHPTISPEMCVKHADYVCVGEGEKTMLEMAEKINNNKDLTGINNLCFLEKGKMKQNPIHPQIENLDDLPQYDHVPVKSFIQKANGEIVMLDKKIFKRYSRFAGKIYDFMGSRGCPFSCTYCCRSVVSSLYQNRRVRRRTVPNMIEELKRVVGENPEIDHVNILDDCFLSCSDKYLEDFCSAYKVHVNKPFWIKSLPIYITSKRMRLLKDAGVSWVELGLQSGSDRTCKDIYNRASFQKDFIESQRIIAAFKIAVSVGIILDNPFETDEDRMKTIRTLMESSKPFYPEIFSLTFYLGSELYKKAMQECPEKVEDSLKKDYFLYQKTPVNEMTRIASFLDKKRMEGLLRSYMNNPTGLNFKISLKMYKIITSLLLEPLTYFKVIKLSLGGSTLKVLEAIPTYLKRGLGMYVYQFKQKK